MQAVDDGYQCQLAYGATDGVEAHRQAATGLVLRPPEITVHETRNMRVRLYLSALKRYKSWHVVQRAVMLESR